MQKLAVCRGPPPPWFDGTLNGASTIKKGTLPSMATYPTQYTGIPYWVWYHSAAYPTQYSTTEAHTLPSTVCAPSWHGSCMASKYRANVDMARIVLLARSMPRHSGTYVANSKKHANMAICMKRQ